MRHDQQDIYDLIPNNGKPLPDGSYWNCVSSRNPVGRHGQIPLQIASVLYEGQTVFIARWPARQEANTKSLEEKK